MEGLANNANTDIANNTGTKHQHGATSLDAMAESATGTDHNSSVHVPYEAVVGTQLSNISSVESEINNSVVTVNGDDLVHVNDSFSDLTELNELEGKMINDDQTHRGEVEDNVSSHISPPNMTGHDSATAERTTDGSSEETQLSTSSVDVDENKQRIDNVHTELSQMSDEYPDATRSAGGPDCTAEETKEEATDVGKDRTVLEDISNDLFTLSINPGKRKSKMAQLKEEVFDHDLYVRNTTGFATSQPVKWSMALEKYIANKATTRCRWRYKKDDQGRYCEANLLLYFDTTKKIDVKINYVNGVLMLQGDAYKCWVNNEFPIVRECFEQIEDCPEEKVEECVRKSAGVSRETTAFASIVDVDLVWQKIDEMQIILKNQDDVMRKMIERCQTIELNSKKQDDYLNNTLPIKLLDVERNVDKRCESFMETTIDANKGKVEELRKNIKGQLDSVKTTIREMQVKLRKETVPSSREEDEVTNIDSVISGKLNDIDFASKIQVELTNTKFLESDDPKLQRWESDIDKLKTEASLNEARFTNLDLRFKQLDFQLDQSRIHTNHAPPQVATPLPTDPSTVFLPPHLPPLPLMQQQSNRSHSTFPERTVPSSRPLQQSAPNLMHQDQPGGRTKESLDLLLCFDSNGKFIDRRKLWKKNNSEYKQCGTFHKLSQEIGKLPS